MAARKTIFVTGGGSGIGRAIAVRFAKEGWFVGLGDIDEDGMEETDKRLPGGYSYRHPFDVTDRAAWDEALRIVARASGGRIDVVANNAGVALGGGLIEASTREIDRIVDVNLRGVIYGAQASYPWLKQTAPGSCLLNTGSAAGFYGVPGTAVYSATKFAVRGLTEALDAEWAEDGIRVRSLMPSYIDTPLLDRPPNAQQTTMMRQLVSQMGREIDPPETVAEAAWQAVHGEKLHWIVGKTARQAAFGSRWMPGRMRRRVREMAAQRRRLLEN
ncbi:MAG TPA: SDR family oxidoreductase [Croceibacterium sp.]|jgi:NAD(P)-dependent dehydrogenase (short-subunit alcohol dehydrogenase family)